MFSFFNNLDRIRQPLYVPSTLDILRMRVQTTGVNESQFQANGLWFRWGILEFSIILSRVIDVGGQRTERRKWIHCFDSVNAVIFIIAINEFDQVLGEDSTTVNER